MDHYGLMFLTTLTYLRKQLIGAQSGSTLHVASMRHCWNPIGADEPFLWRCSLEAASLSPCDAS